jgi:ADP-ribosylglycohydrolase
LSGFEEAMWTTVAGLGDRDTTCAIVGGIVVLAAGSVAVPAEWLASREPLRSLP